MRRLLSSMANNKLFIRSLFAFSLLFAITLIAALLIRVNKPAYAAEPKRVFADYMLAFNAYGVTVEGYRREIQEAKALGLDGFAVNLGGWTSSNPNHHYKTWLANLFEAARLEGPDFKLFISADTCCSLTASDIQDLIKTYSKHPNHYLYEGRPMLITFVGQQKGEAFWQDEVLTPLRQQGYNVYFVPYFSSIPSWWANVSDGQNYFAAGRTPDKMAAYGEYLANLLRQNNKTFMAGFSPYFWMNRSSVSLRRYWEYHGGEGYDIQWNSIINVQKPEWVLFITWNDYTESYMTPADPHNPPIRTGYNIEDTLKHHVGYAELSKYYIQWYKTGTKPRITQDKMFIFYRTHPKDAVATNDTNNIEINGDIQDSLYVTTMLTYPAELRVTTGGVEKRYSVGSGIRHTRIPFNTGQQTFRLYRWGFFKIMEKQGEPILSDIEKYNFTPYSAYVTR